MTTFTLMSGTSKGNRRIWIEGDRLLEAGWTKGDRLVRTMGEDSILLTRGEGKHRVSGNEARPVIDMTGKWVTAFMGQATNFRVELTANSILITPCN